MNLLLEAQTTMKSQYSEEFIEQALVKLLSRGSRSVKSVAQELNVNYHTAKNWLKRGSTVKAGPGARELRTRTERINIIALVGQAV